MRNLVQERLKGPAWQLAGKIREREKVSTARRAR